MQNSTFIIKEENGIMKSLVLRGDKYGMNWVEGKAGWGSCRMREGMSVSVSRKFLPNGRLYESYLFKNDTDFDIFTKEGDVDICACFNDSYHDAKTCEEERCHTHLFIKGEMSWVMALRMGGEAPHLGMMLKKGSLVSYGVERDLERISNDRGDFFLNVEPLHLHPGETYEIAWELFPHNGKEDFKNILRGYDNYIEVNSDKFIYFEGEEIKLSSNAEPAEIREIAVGLGEKTYTFTKNGVKLDVQVLVQPKWEELVAARCRYIAEKQQYAEENSPLDGAYLVYDTKKECFYYSHIDHDHNGGRERVAMGLLLARWLQKNEDEKVLASLKKYMAYIERELFDEETGIVYNDVKRNNDWNRLYNYPWMSTLFIECYRLFGETRYLVNAANAMKAMYQVGSITLDRHEQKGGMEFYALNIPMVELTEELKNAGLTELSEEMKALFLEHAENLRQIGLAFPPSEVNFEQSIVGPAAECMFMAYELSGDKKFLEMGEKILAVLELFSGFQPDFHMYEVGIRHWDGYWFGGNRIFGDTYPHYWSSITGNVYALYHKLTGKEEYKTLAEANLRGSLSLFFPDGSASCAMVYPRTVNGRAANSYDPWANDQDWAAYFYLKKHD
ncbi:MAG: hypothetical protein J6D00_10005 [Christensenellaceae bacterium]|nr:hypothetical protein [Christensenellaceae bacterium]